jgi:small subunit ribosomal protein S7
MSRRRKAVKKEHVPDPKFNSTMVTQFINNVVRCGKRRLAEGIFYDAISIVAERTGQDGLGVFKKAIENVKPFLK